MDNIFFDVELMRVAGQILSVVKNLKNKKMADKSWYTKLADMVGEIGSLS